MLKVRTIVPVWVVNAHGGIREQYVINNSITILISNLRVMKLLTLLFLAMSFSVVGPNAFAQTTTTEDKLVKDESGTYSYETVKTVPGTKKEALYKAMKDWTRKNLKATDKVNYDDANSENINATVAVSTASGTFTEFKMNIDIKDDKFRLSATSPMWHGYGKINPLGDFSGLGVPGFQKKKIINAYEDAMLDLTKALVNVANNANKKSDW